MTCAIHSMVIFDKGGSIPLFPVVNLTRIRWGRVRDDISEAWATIPVNDENCSWLSDLRPYRHEAVVFRNGRRVWEGPITLIRHTAQGVEIRANDIAWWLRRTVIKGDWPRTRNSRSTVTLLADMIAEEMQDHNPYPPPLNIKATALMFTDSVRTTAGFPAWDGYIWTALDDAAARGGVDYTVLGREVLIWDVDDIIGQGRTLTQNDFAGGLEVVMYGAELATRSIVTDTMGGYAYFGDGDEYYGKVELIHDAYGVDRDDIDDDFEPPTTEELYSQAVRNFRGRYPLPASARTGENAQLAPGILDELIDFMVPGVHFPLHVSLPSITWQQMQKLDRLNVAETEAGEIVQVTLGPATGEVSEQGGFSTSAPPDDPDRPSFGGGGLVG